MVKASEQDVLKIIEKTLNLKEKNKTITLESTIHDIEEWDSLGHLGILSALDKFFGGKIGPIREMAKADSVPKILHLLKEHSFI